MNFLTMTNTTKALVISVINGGLGLLLAFGVSITDLQTGAIVVFSNAILTLWVALTYKNSPKRTPDPEKT